MNTLKFNYHVRAQFIKSHLNFSWPIMTNLTFCLNLQHPKTKPLVIWRPLYHWDHTALASFCQNTAKDLKLWISTSDYQRAEQTTLICLPWWVAQRSGISSVIAISSNTHTQPLFLMLPLHITHVRTTRFVCNAFDTPNNSRSERARGFTTHPSGDVCPLCLLPPCLSERQTLSFGCVIPLPVVSHNVIQ